MPKMGMEPIRRAALIDAAIAEVGETGSLDVTVGRIAKRAGVSAALAHHYFGAKDAILLAAMRHLLSEFGASVRASLAGAATPRERLHAIVRASFGPEQFETATIASWLVFYVQAQTSPDAARLLRVYARRLHSNLVHELRQLTARDHAERTAEGLAAMIDGFYIRHALRHGGPDRARAEALAADYLDLQLRTAR